MRGFFLASFAVATTLVAAPARAEYPVDGGTTCAWTRPALAAVLPANVPGLPFPDGRTALLTKVSLTDQAGTAVATRLIADGTDDMVLAIDAPLREGERYTVQWSDQCAVDRKESFTAGPARPLPTRAGELVIGPLKATCSDVPGRWTVDRTVSFDADGAVVSFLAVSKGQLLVYGEPAGDFRAGWGGIRLGSALGALEAQCPGASASPRLSLRVRVANGPTLVTPEVETSFWCEPSAPQECLTADEMPTVRTGTADGCACTAPRASASAWPAVLFALSLVMGAKLRARPPGEATKRT
ncbi:MAG: hypothetical protein HYV09_22290 [Deltaproteobacteria bacterium]|nr:hypothetical protein [Deltaproteobacteria bacterium]